MPSLFARRLGSLITGSLAALFGAPAATAQIPCGGYEVTAVIQPEPCPFTGFPPTIGTGLSDLGHVVGYYRQCDDPTLYEAFLWTPETGLVTLDRPPDSAGAAAADIDENGIIAGTLTYQEFGPNGKNEWNVAAMWETPDAQPIELGIPPRGTDSFGAAINQGQVVGYWANFIAGPLHGFVYEGGVMTDLGPDLGTPSSRANDIKKGKVVGWMGTATSLDARAFIWDAGRVTELPAIPGGFTSEGLAISADGGTVVGVGRLIDKETGDVVVHPFLWKDGEMIDLGVLPGHVLCGALDIRESRIIGGCWFPLPESAFIYQDGIMTDINDLIPADSGVELLGAATISPQGQITGTGHNDQPGDVVAFLLTPIKSPVGDLDGDCAVGIFDLLILLSNWGLCPDPPEPCPADLDGTGDVGVKDLLFLLGAWGPCPP